MNIYLVFYPSKAWLEDAQLIFLIFHTFVGNFFFQQTASTQPYFQTNVLENRKFSRASSSQATSFKLGEYNLLPSNLTLQFTNCEKCNSGKKLFAIEFQYKH